MESREKSPFLPSPCLLFRESRYPETVTITIFLKQLQKVFSAKACAYVFTVARSEKGDACFSKFRSASVFKQSPYPQKDA